MSDASAPRFERLESDHLQTVLAAFGNEDLAPIVDILVGATAVLPGTRLKDTAVYKAYAPDHRRYRREIEADIRAWGSHEIKDAKEPKAYRDIVVDLCGQKGVKTKKSMSVFDMERLLLKKVRGGAPSASPIKSVKAAAKAAGGLAAGGLTAGGGVAGLTTHGRTALQVIAPRAAGAIAAPLAVLGVAWIAWELLGPAFRVTGPCVLAIAEARLRLWCAAVADSVEG